MAARFDAVQDGRRLLEALVLAQLARQGLPGSSSSSSSSVRGAGGSKSRDLISTSRLVITRKLGQSLASTVCISRRRPEIDQ